jgi:hypothetical protein
MVDQAPETSENNPAPSDAPPAAEQDQFAIDEAKFMSLSPEQRAAIDPVLNEWKTKATSKIQETEKTWKEKYTPAEEKAKALDELVKDPRFVGWWNNLQQGVQQGVPGAAQAPVQPRDIATPEEWQQAIADAYVGNGQRMQMLQQRMISAMAAPVVQQLQQGQAELKTTLEMRDLMERHPDIKELDAIGRNPSDPNDKSESLLEHCLEWAENRGLSLEQGYQRAKQWAEAIRVGAKQQAMGMIQDKKAATTSGPSTTQAGQSVVEVEDLDELMKKNMEYALSGQKMPRLVIRPQSTQRSQWTQKT